ncbi:MAG: DUF1631 domain-containing protein [Xanthomonadaceae bacterium]|jgi:hypothetical protein|nr:DUF1631 domain-containing protein [Xanthomonadaceae bacterium]
MTLATAQLPQRVRHILQAVNALAAQSLSASLTATLNELEQQLFQQAERSHSSQHQTDQFVELQLLRRHRSDLIPRYLAGLEHALARIRSASTLEKSKIGASAEPIHFQTLALVDNTDLDRHLVLNEIARRESIRHNNALLLLCQRFGVLAAAPAFDNEQLPVGPYVLCQILSDAGEALQMNLNSQLLLYRMFESQTLSQYGELADQLNTLLADNGVLPGLVYQPYRRRNPSQPLEEKSNKNKSVPHPMTGWSGQSSGSSWSNELLNTLGIGGPAKAAAPEINGNGGNGTNTARSQQNAAFETLRGMLSQRHGVTPEHVASSAKNINQPARPNNDSDTSPVRGFILPPNTMLDVLSTLQPLPPSPPSPGQLRRTLEDVREAALKQIREKHGQEAIIPQEQNDTFELLGMLYNEIGREVRRDAPAQDLLVRLQVPVARVAISDETFFVRDQHPARELLNSVAESGATWLSDGDADPQLVKKLENAVDQVVKEYDGDERTFDRANREIQKHYRSQIHRAELSERRQVEAARGRDRLELARRRAAEVIQSQLDGREPPQFVQMLLNLAWTDVLTLTLLRQGTDSEAWRECEQTTASIVDTIFSEAPLTDPNLQQRIEAALTQVGYHGAEASSIARHLSSAAESEPAAETELETRLKSRAQADSGTETKKTVLPPRNSKEQACYEQLITLPFGTWFEFVLNQQGDVRRQRLSWYSPLTGNTLFINQRGQRIVEQSLDHVARLMARDQARVVTEDKSRLIDRAWQATLRTLRNLTGVNTPTTLSEVDA